jgi:4-alpha-glucanotransferase
LSVVWQDAHGNPQQVTAEAQRALLEALGFPAQSPEQIEESIATLQERHRNSTVGPLIVADQGQALSLAGHFKANSRFRLQLEGDRRLEGRLDAQACLPPLDECGYHALLIGDERLALAVAPPACPSVRSLSGGLRGHVWGLGAQLYALRRAGDGGLGDTQALEILVRHAAAHGADALAISPVHAMFSALPGHYSPYSPSSRLFFNILHASPGCILGEHTVAQAISTCGLEAEWQRLEALELIDWPAVSKARLQVLRQLHAGFSGAENQLSPDFDSFCAHAGEALLQHCRFEALHEQMIRQGLPGDWRLWPEQYHDPNHPAVSQFASEHADEVRFHAFAQWLIDRCLQRAHSAAKGAGMCIGLIADLAVGAEPGGSQGWSRQSELLPSLSVGAPPDLINRAGQNWGVAAFSPEGLQQNGYRAFIEMLRANLAHAGGLRIDHAMGLQRLWVIPQGASPEHGAYLRYPCADLLRLIALEASRHQALVIGEDLGTVPEGLGEHLARRGVLGMRVLYFEQKKGRFIPPEDWSADALATTTTHDLPSITGWLSGRDIRHRQDNGQIDATRARLDLQQRELEKRALADLLRERGVLDEGTERADAQLDGCIQLLGRTPAPLVLLPLEDVLASEEQPNLPGPGDRHPNWRRRWPWDASELLDRPKARARLQLLERSRLERDDDPDPQGARDA